MVPMFSLIGTSCFSSLELVILKGRVNSGIMIGIYLLLSILSAYEWLAFNYESHWILPFIVGRFLGDCIWLFQDKSLMGGRWSSVLNSNGLFGVRMASPLRTNKTNRTCLMVRGAKGTCYIESNHSYSALNCDLLVIIIFSVWWKLNMEHYFHNHLFKTRKYECLLLNLNRYHSALIK